MKGTEVKRSPAGAPRAETTSDSAAPGGATRGRFLMQVLWPSFLVAIPCVGLFFSAIDPAELEVVREGLAGSSRGAYTLGFLLAWLALAAASALTYLLAHKPR